MCEIMEKYEKMAADKATDKERIDTISKMIKKNYSKEAILDLDYTEEEYQKAAQRVSANVLV